MEEGSDGRASGDKDIQSSKEGLVDAAETIRIPNVIVAGAGGDENPTIGSNSSGVNVTKGSTSTTKNNNNIRRPPHPNTRTSGTTTIRKTNTNVQPHPPITNSSSSSNSTNRIYVGNLPWEATWRDLKDHFRTVCGIQDIVRVDILTTPPLGRSKGCAIVQFPSPERAQYAIQICHNTELMGRRLWAREDRETLVSSAEVDDSIKINSTSSLTAHPTLLTTITNHNNTNIKPNTNNNTINSSSTLHSAAQSRRVYVGNLSWDVAWQDLKDHMRQAGDVLFAEVMTEANTGRSKGCGIVEFHTSEDAQRAIRTLNDTELKGRMIFVREDREGPQQHALHSTTNTTPLSGSSTIPTSTSIHHTPSKEADITHTLHPTRSNDSPTTSLFISNIPWNTTWYQLKDFISTTTTAVASTSPTTTNCPVLPEHVQIVSVKGGRTPYAIVRYDTTQDAQYAKEALQGVKFMSKTLDVRFDRQSPRSK